MASSRWTAPLRLAPVLLLLSHLARPSTAAPTESPLPRCAHDYAARAARCGLLLFRHNPKTAGTSIRQYMGAGMARHCGWRLVKGYVSGSRLRALGRVPAGPAALPTSWLHSLLVSNASQNGPSFPLSFAEDHTTTYAYREMLLELPRVARAWPRCRFVMFALVREPESWALSRCSYFSSYRKLFPSFWRDFLPCAAKRRTQKDLAWGNACHLQVEFILPESYTPRLSGAAVGSAWVTEQLSAPHVFVGVFERMAESLALLQHRMGAPFTGIVRGWAHKRRKKGGELAEWLRRNQEERARDPEAARALAREALADDYTFYRAANAVLDARLLEAAKGDGCFVPLGTSRAAYVGALADIARQKPTNGTNDDGSPSAAAMLATAEAKAVRARSQPQPQPTPIGASQVVTHLRQTASRLCKSNTGPAPSCADVGYPPTLDDGSPAAPAAEAPSSGPESQPTHKPRTRAEATLREWVLKPCNVTAAPSTSGL